MPMLRAQFAMGPLEVGLLGSALVLGAVFGAVLGGHLSDRLGRKDVFLADMALLAVAALILVLADSIAWLLAGQLLVGVAIGMDFPAASAYVAEIMPASERQKMVVGTITFQAVGMVLASFLTVWLLERSGGGEAWRWLFASLAVLAILFFALRLTVPESPHWLADHGHLAEATRVAERLNRGVISHSDEPVTTVAPTEPPRGYGALFAPAFAAD